MSKINEHDIEFLIKFGFLLVFVACIIFLVDFTSKRKFTEEIREVEYQEYLVVKEKNVRFSKAHNTTFVDFYVYKNGKIVKANRSDIRTSEVNVGDTVLCGVAQKDDWFWINILNKK